MVQGIGFRIQRLVFGVEVRSGGGGRVLKGMVQGLRVCKGLRA